MVLAVFLDIQKAFETVDHRILFAKLEHAGVRGVSLDWFKSLMTKQRQQVRVGDSLSPNMCFIDIGVLQGSILGVILFIIFMNYIKNCAPRLFKIMFVDDISVLLR